MSVTSTAVRTSMASDSSQALRGLQQPAAVLDHLTDVIRQTAVGERHMVRPLENHDLGELIQPPGPRRARHARGDPAHHNDLHHVSAFAPGAFVPGPAASP
jgi:hypothetical protein